MAPDLEENDETHNIDANDDDNTLRTENILDIISRLAPLWLG